MERKKFTTISYGGGVQSTALIILAATGQIEPVDVALFSNVGEDSEHPSTITYVRDVMTPWAASRGLPVHELRRTLRSGETQTLWQRMMDYDGEKLREPIPLFGWSGAPMSRSCTLDHKIKVLGKFVKKTVPKSERPVRVLIGISTDEYQRANKGKNEAWEERVYPLLELNLSRNDCIEIIKDAGLPVPHKSSCFFCPFHSANTWSELKQNEPELFNKAVLLENTLNERRSNRGMAPVYLTRKGKPLIDVVALPHPSLFEEEPFNEGKCDDGACWT
jgi:hypothetical protein